VQRRSASLGEYRLRCYVMTAELFRAAALGARDCQAIRHVIRVRGNANPGKTFTRCSEAAAKVTFAAKPLLCARFFAFALVAQLDRAHQTSKLRRDFCEDIDCVVALPLGQGAILALALA
jgi:hypothetical protein